MHRLYERSRVFQGCWDETCRSPWRLAGPCSLSGTQARRLRCPASRVIGGGSRPKKDAHKATVVRSESEDRDRDVRAIHMTRGWRGTEIRNTQDEQRVGEGDGWNRTGRHHVVGAGNTGLKLNIFGRSVVADPRRSRKTFVPLATGSTKRIGMGWARLDPDGGPL